MVEPNQHDKQQHGMQQHDRPQRGMQQHDKRQHDRQQHDKLQHDKRQHGKHAREDQPRFGSGSHRQARGFTKGKHGTVREHDGQRAAASSSNPLEVDLASFKLLYENRSHTLCLFEDADGHLIAVDPDRLA